MPYLSASAVVIHYEEALYQVYAPLPFTRHLGQLSLAILLWLGAMSISVSCEDTGLGVAFATYHRHIIERLNELTGT